MYHSGNTYRIANNRAPGQAFLTMFEITSEDIALLNDEDLRSLIGRLCESELSSRGLPTSYVTWGGNQNAPDGGIDVRVSLPATTSITGFVPSLASGFQVKAEDMQPAKIFAEMRPEDAVRPAIRDLADQAGAYVIVSSKGSTSDAALISRRDAMAGAVSDLPNASALTLDFYDRTRLATWVRGHLGLVPWVREKIGKSIKEWHPYGDWARTPDGVNGAYLLDESLRVQTGTKDGLRIADGIDQIRDLLREPGRVVRLVGLSGVGKTRFVQALFDDRVGEQNLDPSLAAYTNMADDPDPQPTGLASDLQASHTKAILVIDNCPPDLHRRLSEVCRMPLSTVSVITVEYDIHDDQPEGTEVFKLDPSSIDLIEKLVKHRFPKISITDAGTVADFSGGNARIAIALASAIGSRETIAGLTDEELVRRLVQQRHDPDESLQLAAEACALVYSFQAEDIPGGEPAELGRLGAMIEQSAQEVYRHVSELRRRDLVQRRSIWRAVLPHALANRLATRALQNIPLLEIEAQLVNGAPTRLLKSFSRRLGYLHTNNEARAIVTKWLAIGGLLGDLSSLNDIGFAMFESVAPTAPDAALEALERTLLVEDDRETIWRCRRYIHVLRSLAYESSFFERCITLIAKIAEAGDINERSNEAKDVFVALFYLYLSGTRATPTQRLSIIERFLGSEDEKRRNLGFLELRAALEAGHFTSYYSFEFGAHPRDHGYWPSNDAEAKSWYCSTLQLSETVARSDGRAAFAARAASAEKFHVLWNRTGLYEELDHLARAVRQKQFWREGWLAVRQTIKLSAQSSPEISARLTRLEKALRPIDLVQKVRSIVLSKRYMGYEPDEFDDYVDDDPQSAFDRTESIARGLGKAVAADEGVFNELIPELMSSDGRLWSFGRGLAEGVEKPGAIWSRLVSQLAVTAEDQRRVQILCGFLHGLYANDPELVNQLLDDALQEVALAAWYPILQVSVDIDRKGTDRLMRSVRLGNAPTGTYRHLSIGRATDPIPGNDFRDLVLAIAEKQDGFDVAMDILYMRLLSEKKRNQSYVPEVVDAGRQLLRQLKFSKRNAHEDYFLEEIAKVCLTGEEGALIVREVCRKLKAAVSNYQTYAFHNDDLLNGFLSVQPIATLDGLLGGGASELKLGSRILAEVGLKTKLLDVVPDGDLFAWCDAEPAARYPAVAAMITISNHSGENGSTQWTTRALEVLRRAPERVEVLKQFIQQFKPAGGWTGSLATILASNATLLDQLEAYDDPALLAFLPQARVRLRQAMEAERQRETAMERQSDERFEW